MKDPHCPKGQLEFDFDMADATAGYFCKEELQMSDIRETGDMVNNPPHYNMFPIECHEVSGRLPGHESSAFEYLWRCQFKGAYVEDLKKAYWHIDMGATKHLEGAGVHPAWDPHNDEELQLLVLQVASWFPARIGSSMLHITNGDHAQALRCIQELIDNATPQVPAQDASEPLTEEELARIEATAFANFYLRRYLKAKNKTERSGIQVGYEYACEDIGIKPISLSRVAKSLKGGTKNGK